MKFYERIPTFATQLKMLCTVKASSIGSSVTGQVKLIYEGHSFRAKSVSGDTQSYSPEKGV